ncbi:MAG: 16S rRNA (cytidine(1402)-2'-O)-methyltransferase, partial [Acidimicrobiales bacterium]
MSSAAGGEADGSGDAAPRDPPGGAPTTGGAPPPGTLVLVATPIGNLGDLTRRAIDVLAAVDIVCCEDTRRTRALLSAAGVPGAGRLRSLHARNEAARVPGLLDALAAGRTVAVVSDAGTPAVSDPGARLVSAAIGAGVAVTVVPGASSVLAALVVSGLPTDRFCVEGFLPRKGSARRARLESIISDERTAVVLEAPGRLAATLAELAALAPQRAIAVCRELTKLHEEVWRGTAAGAEREFAARAVRGEVVVVIGGAPRDDVDVGGGGDEELAD